MSSRAVLQTSAERYPHGRILEAISDTFRTAYLAFARSGVEAPYSPLPHNRVHCLDLGYHLSPPWA